MKWNPNPSTIFYIGGIQNSINNFDSNYHVMPPFRSAEDLIKLQEAIANKTVATICSDHQPHNEDAKQAPFSNTQHGISSIEILLPLLMELVDLGLIDINTAISSVTSNLSLIHI